MADNATYVSDFDVNRPGDHDSRFGGAAEIRAVKTALKNTFPNLQGPVEASDEVFNLILKQQLKPRMIMFWCGPEDEVPNGWALCTGQVKNGHVTPNLRDRFIMGWSEETAIGEHSPDGDHFYEGGFAKFVDSKEHKLTLEQIPAHDHGIGHSNYKDETDRDYPVPTAGNTRSVVSGKAGGDKDGNTVGHKHALVDKEDAPAFDKRPAWYALAYIMYVGGEV